MPASGSVSAFRQPFNRWQISSGSTYFLADVDQPTLLGAANSISLKSTAATWAASSTSPRPAENSPGARRLSGHRCDQEETALVSCRRTGPPRPFERCWDEVQRVGDQEHGGLRPVHLVYQRCRVAKATQTPLRRRRGIPSGSRARM